MFDAIEGNVSEFLLEMGRAGGGVERNDSQVRWTVGGSPIDYHNAVVGCDAPDAARARELAQEFLGELRAHDVPGCWHLHPAMAPADLGEVLVAAGFEDAGSEPAMAMRLTGPLAPVSSDLSIEVVADDAALDRYRQVLADGFGEGPTEADWVTSVFRSIGASSGRWRHFVGSVDGEPVATSTILRTGAVAGVYFVATRPAFRRRGFGTAITAHALDDARSSGARTAILGSSPMGKRIYERLGFREYFEYRLFEARP